MSGKVSSLKKLRHQAVCQSLFRPTTLKDAIEKLAFVQADPIRSPATAQDLILRHRVKGYRAGDLERKYSTLNIEEDFLYVYGFLPTETWKLLHPRNLKPINSIERKVLKVVQKYGPIHPKELEDHLGKDRVINAWGGYSKASKVALERLHFNGSLRIARREKGIRIYESANDLADTMDDDERSRELVKLIAKLLAPVPQQTLQEVVARVRRSVKGLEKTPVVLNELIASGDLQKESVEGITYIWPTTSNSRKALKAQVRFLAPFDPIVWDRRRFEHLWGWPYRFEAYTPKAKRIRGYYAMPLLWGDDVIGWANIDKDKDDLNVELGFIESRPRDSKFRSELELEIERMKTFLNIKY